MKISPIISITALGSVVGCASQPLHQELSQMSGEQIYGQLCTSCHGVSGRGNGPMAPLLKVDVPDLTHIAQRHGGKFPAEHVRSTIDGRFERPAHGLPYMPVWGWKLYGAKASNAAEEHSRANSLIERLVEYLRSIQND